MKIETNDSQLKKIIKLAEVLEDSAIPIEPSRLKKLLSDLHYNTRVFVRPELGQVKNENK